ncbi:MAG: SpaH/EbpB family LPXTG-anchored major pilin [Oscillospiraceae bacterium]
MKKIHRVLALLLAALMALGLMTTAFAATDSAPIIDPGKKASLSIYKYDITTAGKDGAWDAESYVSTGLHDGAVTDKLSKYAIQGVEFTYLRIADITMNNELVDGQRQVGVLYGFDSSDRSTTVLSAIGLTGADAHKTEGGVNYYTSDALSNKLSTALTANATTVKNALETAVKNGGVAMSETDVTGHTSASDMEQGLYLVVETRVPENVTSTCNPFFVSLPMTTIDGAAWNYDVSVYPKNQTGNPNLEKTVRENKNSTGKHNGSLTDIKDSYAHTATASAGDVVDYQIISTLPTITSKASSLSEYTYADTMSKGIKYNKNDVAIEFFKDSGCTDKITTWAEDSGKFTVAYDDAQNIMTIRVTEAGLSEINEAATVYTDSVKRGYSDCTMRITYAATLTADAATYGGRDNPNRVKLTWKRTNTTYYDTLEDCCHVYVYAIDLIKQFSDNNGTFGKVKFIAYNDTDGYYIKANMEGEVYNVTGFTSNKAEATMLIPNLKGHIILRGIEDDTYTLTEVATDKGYVLLRDPVKIMVITKEDGACERCGAALLTASATVNGEPVSMTDANAVVPLRIINNPGFDLPKTGGYGVWMYTVGGVLLLGAAAFIVIRSRKHKNEQ